MRPHSGLRRFPSAAAWRTLLALQFLHRKVRVGVNANFAGDAHGLEAQILWGKLGMLEQGASSRECIAATGADSTEPVVWLDHVAISGKEKGGFAVGDDEQRFQVA